MQHQTIKNPTQPKQFVDRICKKFKKAIQKKERAAQRAAEMQRQNLNLSELSQFGNLYENAREGIPFHIDSTLRSKKDNS
jgi:hypothetical protein